MLKALVSLSGGMDSAVVLARCVAQHGEDHVQAVGFTYGSKHNAYEWPKAQALAKHYGAGYHLIDLTAVMREFASDLLKTGGEVPEGHYEAESMRRTVVPFRNGIFTAVLAGLAESLGAGEVWLGVHAGDHHIYPDCRPEFVYSMNHAVCHGTDHKVMLWAPFQGKTKAEILKVGLALGVPFRLTRTCYCDQPVACGRCGSCQERLEAFAKNGVEDPLEYESRELLPK